MILAGSILAALLAGIQLAMDTKITAISTAHK